MHENEKRTRTRALIWHRGPLEVSEAPLEVFEGVRGCPGVPSVPSVRVALAIDLANTVLTSKDDTLLRDEAVADGLSATTSEMSMAATTLAGTPPVPRRRSVSFADKKELQQIFLVPSRIDLLEAGAYDHDPEPLFCKECSDEVDDEGEEETAAEREAMERALAAQRRTASEHRRIAAEQLIGSWYGDGCGRGAAKNALDLRFVVNEDMSDEWNAKQLRRKERGDGGTGEWSSDEETWTSPLEMLTLCARPRLRWGK